MPYLKGLHLTIEVWRKDRDEEGWKRWRSELDDMEAEIMDELSGKIKELRTGDEEGAEEVKSVPRLRGDLEPLKRLTEDVEPPRRVVRGKEIGTVRYGFGDACRGGFGAS